MPITALPPAPSRSDPTNFATKADAWVAAMALFTTEANALQADVNTKQTNAATSETNAANSAASAATSAANALVSANAAANAPSAPKWVSGNSYNDGDVVWSPSTYLTYRSKGANPTSTTDPSLLPNNWTLMNSEYGKLIITGTSVTAISGWHYILTNASQTNVTLPATANNYDRIRITVANGRVDNNVLRNGLTIMGLSEDMLLNISTATVTLEYLNSTWRIV